MAFDLGECAATWSPERVEMLRLHYSLGLSAAISAQLIGDVSRNAVISKRRRLGLTGINPLQAARRALGRTCRRAPAPQQQERWRFPPEDRLPREPLPCMDAPPPPEADPKRLADRNEHECAWPLGPAETPGDYRTLFCCAPIRPGESYCPVHRRRARRCDGPPAQVS